MRYLHAGLLGLLIGVVTIGGATEVEAQATFGSPYIENISPEEYQAKIQNWNAAQTSNGLMYIANLGGVLEYDGENWRTIDLPNTTALSLGIQSDTVFVGGVDEIGYLYSSDSDSSHTRYKSLTDQIPASVSDLGDIWQAIPTANGIYFRTGKYLLRYSGGSFKYWKSNTGFHFAFNVRGELYINIREQGLHKIEGDELELVEAGETFSDDGIYAMLPFKNGTILMATRFKNLIVYDGNEIREFKSEANEFLEEHRLYNGLKLSDGSFVFGTLRKGLIRIDEQGNVLNIINKETGLLTDVIYHLFEDREGNLWVSQNQGLSVVNILSPVTVFDARHGLEGMPRSIYADNDQLYVGTRHGIFQYSDSNFQRVFDIDRVPRDFIRYNNRLLFVASDGLSEIKDDEVILRESFRYANVVCKSSIHPDILFVGTREEFIVVRDNGETFSKLGEIEEIESEVTTIAEDLNGNLWVGALTDGIYQLSWQKEDQLLDPQIKTWKIAKGEARVFQVGRDVYFTFENSFVRYNADQDSLVRVTNFDQKSGSKKTNDVFLASGDRKKNIWMRAGQKNLKFIPAEDGSYTEEPNSLNLIQSNQYNFIYPDNKGYVWIGTDEGLIRYNDTIEYADPPDYDAFVREVLVHNDSLIYAGPRDIQRHVTLDYGNNELRFRYSAPTFTRSDDIEYQVFLEGFDPGWSSWTSEINKDYTNIPEGRYTFRVRARNIHNKISKAGTFDFTVLPPWYRTFWAYGLYLIVIAVILYGVHRFRIDRILREQRIRNRIASDLHDEVSATLSSITYFAQAIRQSENGFKADRFVELISESANEAKEKISDIIWSIDPDQDDWVNLLSKCRRFASDLFESKGMDYELDIATDVDRPLDLELRQHLWLIFKEMVVNAARHSQAKRVDVFFGVRNDRLELVVQDNGIGLPDTLDENRGHGIKNIKKRARQLGGNITLDSDHEIGTRWVMQIKM